MLHPGERELLAEGVVALPRGAGPALAGLPADARGFVPTDLHGKVPGVDAVEAAGDAIAFPVKQGSLAAQQADAAAEAQTCRQPPTRCARRVCATMRGVRALRSVAPRRAVKEGHAAIGTLMFCHGG